MTFKAPVETASINTVSMLTYVRSIILSTSTFSYLLDQNSKNRTPKATVPPTSTPDTRELVLAPPGYRAPFATLRGRTHVKLRVSPGLSATTWVPLGPPNAINRTGVKLTMNLSYAPSTVPRCAASPLTDFTGNGCEPWTPQKEDCSKRAKDISMRPSKGMDISI